jgi:hypothetical protein
MAGFAHARPAAKARAPAALIARILFIFILLQVVAVLLHSVDAAAVA